MYSVKCFVNYMKQTKKPYTFHVGNVNIYDVNVHFMCISLFRFSDLCKQYILIHKMLQYNTQQTAFFFI